MPDMEKEEFKFPDEQEVEVKAEENADSVDQNALEIEIEDDTPAEDRGRKPVSPEVVKKIEVQADELDAYSQEAKDKLIKMKHIWHDERRAKEAALREQQEAVALAQKLMAENERIKKMLQSGEEEYKEAKKESAQSALQTAKRQYKEAYEIGDAEAMAEAQEAMTKAQLNLEKVEKFKLPPLQEEKIDVQPQYQAPPEVPKPDKRAMEWQERNSWFGQDEEMTAAALGLHEKMKRNGVVIGSDEYYETLDKTIRKRFAENFDSEVEEEPKQVKEKAEVRTKPNTVVAPATRSTAPNRIRLKQSQVLLAKKLGLTPEQYALALKKLEAQNG